VKFLARHRPSRQARGQKSGNCVSLPFLRGDALKAPSDKGAVESLADRAACNGQKSQKAQPMRRGACCVSLEFATPKKPRNPPSARGFFYIGSLWQVRGGLDKETLARRPAEWTRLQAMQKDQALCQTLSIVSSMPRSAKAQGAQA